jgi:hypothetical protein
VRCETTNGAIFVTVPKDAKASVSLRVSNGGISTSGLDMAVSEQSRRRVDGTIGGGGPNIKLETHQRSYLTQGKVIVPWLMTGIHVAAWGNAMGNEGNEQ